MQAEPSTPLELLAAAPGEPPPAQAWKRLQNDGALLGLAPGQELAALKAAIGNGPWEWGNTGAAVSSASRRMTPLQI